jgi:HAE1 family hydrophobic/amphiphilic exporter-1
VVEKFNLDAAPVVTLAVSGRRSLREITEIARKLIKEDLEGVSGVGAVVLVGGQGRAVNVWVNPARLRGRELSVEDVRQALQRQNLELPGGRVDQGGREEVLRTLGRVEPTGTTTRSASGTSAPSRTAPKNPGA